MRSHGSGESPGPVTGPCGRGTFGQKDTQGRPREREAETGVIWPPAQEPPEAGGGGKDPSRSLRREGSRDPWMRGPRDGVQLPRSLLHGSWLVLPAPPHTPRPCPRTPAGVLKASGHRLGKAAFNPLPAARAPRPLSRAWGWRVRIHSGPFEATAGLRGGAGDPCVTTQPVGLRTWPGPAAHTRAGR